LACSSPIEPELSMMKRISTSLLMLRAMLDWSSEARSTLTPFSGWSRHANNVGSATAETLSSARRDTMGVRDMGTFSSKCGSRAPAGRAGLRPGWEGNGGEVYSKVGAKGDPKDSEKKGWWRTAFRQPS